MSRMTIRTAGLVMAIVALSTLVVGVGAADQVDLDPGQDLAGSGTAGDPYIITNASGLQAMEDDLDTYYRLGNDINATETKGWNSGNGFDPVGSDTPFTGVFNGSGYVIEGLFINIGQASGGEKGANAALFARVGEDGIIERVGLRETTVTAGDGGSVSTVGSAGRRGGHASGLVAENHGNVSKSYTAKTDATAGDGSDGYFGGNLGPDAGRGGDGGSTGGLVAINEGTVNTSYAINTTLTAGNGGDGGLGGAFGDSDGGDGGDGGDVGGLIGENSGTLNKTYVVDTSAAAGDHGDGNIARDEGSDGSDGNNGNSGGVAGSNTSVIDSTYWDTERTSENNGVGSGDGSGVSGLLTQEMKGSNASSNMSAFDFSRTWETVKNGGDDTTGDGYPILQSVDRQAQLEAQNVNAYAGGDGSESTPYEISNWYHLDNVSRNPGSEFVLTTDLDSSTAGYDNVGNSTADGGEGFNPIGEIGNEFTGKFNGTNHTISDLYIDRGSTDYVGLFGYVNGGTVEDVGAENVDITGNNDVGGIVGQNSPGNINDSYASGDVDGGDNVGGLVGHNTGDVTESYATGDVSGSDEVGGLVGYNFDGDVTASYASGDVDGNTYVGGLVGYNQDSKVTASYASGDVDGSTDVGGLVGNNFIGTVSDSYWDRGTTNQSSAIGSGSGSGLIGFGSTSDTTAAPEMQRFAPQVNMDPLDFISTWNVTSGYPRLAWESVDELTVDSVEVNDTTTTAGNETDINVTANEGGTNAGEGVTVRVIANDSLGELPEDTTAVTDENGNATFTFNEKTAADYDLEFAWGDDTTVSDTATVTVDPANATRVTVDTEPTDSTAGGAIAGPPRANVTDTFGNPVDGVTVTVFEEGDYAFDSGTETNKTIDGITTFDDLFINDSADYQLNFSISADDAGVDASVSSLTGTFNVTAADADSLRIIDAPDSVDAGAEFNFTINATDEFDNLAADQTLADLAVDSEFDDNVFGPSDVTLNKTGSTNVTIDTDEVTTANDSHTLAVTADGVSDDSVDITVDETDPDTVEVDTQPTSTTANESIDGPPAVSVTDASGNDLSDVTLSASLNESGGLRGTTEIDTNETGVAAFEDLRVKDASSYNLTIEVDGDSTVNATTDDFEITAATPDAVAVETQPTDTDAETDIGGPPTANVTDAFGNPIAGENVTATINASVNLNGATDIETAADGFATFDELNISEPGTYNLTFELIDDGSVNATTNTFEIDPTKPFFAVKIKSTNEPVDAGDTLDVTVEVTNTGADGTQTVNLTDTDFTDSQQDDIEVDLDRGESNDSVDLQWDTGSDDDGTGDITVATPNESDAASVTVDDPGGNENNNGGGGGGGSSSSESGETSVTIGEDTVEDDEDAETDEDGETDNGDESGPDTSVSVSNPQPGQRLVIEGGEARIEAGEDDSDESDGDEEGEGDDESDDEVGEGDNESEAVDDEGDGDTDNGGGDTDDASDGDDGSSSDVRADRLAVDINTDRDFTLSITTYNNDLSRSSSLTPVRSVRNPVARGGALLSTRDREATVTAPEDIRGAATAFQRATDSVSAGYIDIDHTLAPGEMSGATFAFSVNRAYLDELGVDTEDVVLHHQTDDGWVTRETEYVESTDSRHRFEGTMPEFSVFAIATGAEPLGVTAASLRESQVAAGEEATITATVTNRGQAEAEKSVTLTVDGDTVDTTNVTLPGNESTEVSFIYRPSETGEYDLVVGDTPAGLLTVSDPTGSWILLLGVLVAATAAVLLWWRHSRDRT